MKKRDADELKEALRTLIPYARRYAHGRMTYATGDVNRAIDLALKHGVPVEDDAAIGGRRYCADGNFGEWDPEHQRFFQKETL